MDDFNGLLGILSMHHVPRGKGSSGEFNLLRDLEIIADHWTRFDKDNCSPLLGEKLSTSNRNRKKQLKEKGTCARVRTT